MSQYYVPYFTGWFLGYLKKVSVLSSHSENQAFWEYFVLSWHDNRDPYDAECCVDVYRTLQSFFESWTQNWSQKYVLSEVFPVPISVTMHSTIFWDVTSEMYGHFGVTYCLPLWNQKVSRAATIEAARRHGFTSQKFIGMVWFSVLKHRPCWRQVDVGVMRRGRTCNERIKLFLGSRLGKVNPL
jgi:hypothetical protein